MWMLKTFIIWILHKCKSQPMDIFWTKISNFDVLLLIDAAHIFSQEVICVSKKLFKVAKYLNIIQQKSKVFSVIILVSNISNHKNQHF